MSVLPSLCSSCPAHGQSPLRCPAYPSSCSDKQWDPLGTKIRVVCEREDQSPLGPGGGQADRG